MSNEIKCPHCGEVFKIDESNFDSIVKQIRNHEFNEELEKRVKEKVQLEMSESASKHKDELNDKSKEYEALKNKSYQLYIEQNNKIDLLNQELASLKEKQKNEIALEVSNAIRAKEETFNKEKKELENQIQNQDVNIASLNEQIKQSNLNKDNEIKLKVSDAIKEKEDLIKNLQASIDKMKIEYSSELNQIKSKKDQELLEANSKINQVQLESKLSLESERKNYELEIKNLNEQLQMAKDFKTRQSTKAIGESLEVYCHNEFDKIRFVAFPNAYFDKDNKISDSGSKGDFIFRDYADGIEFVSIMFEMKNEADTTEKKHKNEDFYKELDKDRKEKNCEYAILVSMLEADNDYFNQGIVNVSHLYPNMYVIRPQFFIPIIGLIRTEALKNLNAKKELELAKQQDVDFTNFTNNLLDFQTKFSKNYESAHTQFEKSIEEIDKSISHLQKVKDALTSCDRQLRLANDKAQDLSVKKLTKNAPSVATRINESTNNE